MPRLLAHALAAACLAAPALDAQCPQWELTPSDLEPDHQYGSRVVLDGDQAWVAAPGWRNGAGDEVGKVYRMSLDGPTLGSFSPNALDGARYGDALAVDGDTVVVGAWATDVPTFNAGRVWIHEWDGSAWQTSILQSDSPKNNARFGRSVDIEGDLLAVGAPSDNAPLVTPAVHVYRRVGGVWGLEQVISPDTPNATDFGRAVRLDGGRLFVSDPKGDSGTPALAGAVYAYTFDGAAWSGDIIARRTLVPGLSDSGLRYGQVIDVDGDTLAIGAPESVPSPFGGSGAVDVWRETAPGTWEREFVLGSDTGRDRLGVGVAIHGDRILAGAPEKAYPEITALNAELGLVYAYQRQPDDTWVTTHRLRPVHIVEKTNFGFGVDLDDDHWVAGGRQVVNPDGDVGLQVYDAALVDQVDPWVDLGGGLDTGVSPTVDVYGALCQGSTVWFWTRMNAAGTGWLVAGFSQLGAPFKGGTLVPFPDLLFGPLPATPTPTLPSQFTIDLPITVPVPAGVTVVMQLWRTNWPVFSGPFSASDGVAATSGP